MKKVFFSISLVMLAALSSNAQIQNFDLSKYQLPYLKRQLLDVNFNLGESSSNSSTQYYTDKYQSFNGVGNLNYNYYFNSIHYQFDENVAFNLNSTTNDSKNTNTSIPTDETNAYNIGTRLNFSGQNRMYDNQKRFLEIDLNTYNSAGLSNQKDISKDSSNKSSIVMSQFEIPIKIGFGRIERVEDARLAVYILNDLSINQKLSHQPTDDEILAFSKLISELKNERFFDARIKKIYELTKVDSFLRSNNLVKENDIKSFSLINDNWDYAAGPARSSGFRFALGCSPRVNVSQNKTEYTPASIYNNKWRNQELQGSLLAEFVYERPLNLFWQESFSIQSGYRIGKTTDYYNSNINNVYRDNATFINFSAGAGYYPNSRTYINFNINGMWQHQIAKYNNGNVTNNSFDLFPSIIGYYYVSPQLRLTLNESVSYNTTIGNKYFNNRFNIGFTYSFF